MSVFILTEKPSVALSISKVLGATNRFDGYFEGNGYCISFAFGHLLQLYDAQDYDPKMKNWELNNFPFIPDTFKYKLMDDIGAKKQFKIIKELVNRTDIDLIINAGDSDREGELLSHMILSATGTRKPVKRLWVSSHTPDDIKKGLNNLRTGNEMQGLINAGYCRQHVDYILGANITAVATLLYKNNCNSTNKNKPLSLGRLILPVTKLIYDRDMTINNFRPEDYFELKTIFNAKEGQYEGLYYDESNNSKFSDKKEIQKIVNDICDKDGMIIEKNVTIVKQSPSRLFNLSDLQGHITSKYSSFTSDIVLKIAQKLYENQYITYPRTESRMLDDTQVSDAQRALNAVVKGTNFEDKVKFTVSKKVFDSTKVDSHPAITPTYIVPSGLSKNEEIVYEEIRKRFISQFMPLAEYENTEIITSVNNHLFETKGKILVKEGWLEVYGKEVHEKEDLLPNVKKNTLAKVMHSQILEKQTQPPAHYTEKTMLKAMETCGKSVKDDDDIMGGFSIGTAATRAECLAKIQRLGYVLLKGKSFYISDVGIKLIEILPCKELMDPNYTGKLEKKLKDIELGKYSKDSLLNEVILFTKNTVELMKNSTKTISITSESTREVLGKCPDCGNDIVEGKLGFGCMGYKSNGCKFVLWAEDKFLAKYKKKMTKTLAKSLLKNKSADIKGMVSPSSGKKFDCKLNLLKQENGYWCLRMEFNNTPSDNTTKESKKICIGKCFNCGGEVIEKKISYNCECGLNIWKEDKFLEKFKKKMTKSIAKELITKGSIYFEDLYSDKKKSTFKATLRLKKNNDQWGYEFDFNK